MTTRSLFQELSAGIRDMAAHRKRKITLRSTTIPAHPTPPLRAGDPHPA
jgi:hypothetical protein